MHKGKKKLRPRRSGQARTIPTGVGQDHLRNSAQSSTLDANIRYPQVLSATTKYSPRSGASPFSDELIERLRAQLESRSGRRYDTPEVELAAENLVRYFELLVRWAKEEQEEKSRIALTPSQFRRPRD